jgi:hypothetical protein
LTEAVLGGYINAPLSTLLRREAMKEDRDMKKELSEDFAVTDHGLKEAVRSVYKRYGTNLSEFFEDAYQEEERERRNRARDDTVEACSM